MSKSAMIKRIDGPGKSKAVMPVGKVLTLRQRDPWREATEKAREVATHREAIVHFVRQQMDMGVSQNNAIALMIGRHEKRALPPYLAAAMNGAARAGRSAPSKSTISSWCKVYFETGNIAELLPDHKGRVVEAASWWGPALEYYNTPGVKMDMGATHRHLVEVLGFAVTYDQVRSYLSSVPAMVGRNSPARLGKNLYRLTQKAYVRRSTDNALPGDVYVADGYRADVYLAHPVTGDLWRPEITLAMDLRSRVIVGWRVDEHEGTIAVQNMWAETFARWGHVPPFLYIDNGSGYKNKLMSDELTGFYARAGVQQIIHSIPGNPHGKGWVERIFRIIRDDFLKGWRPAFYCGPDMASEVQNHTVRECKVGRMTPPSLAEFVGAFNEWIGRYVSRPHPEDKTVTRAQLWAELVPIPPVATLTELKRQAVTLTVRRATVRQGKRDYAHHDLHAFNGQRVLMEYDLMDDSIAVIKTLEGRWICDAHLVKKVHGVSSSRLEEKRQLSAKDAVKRLEIKIQEQKDRAGLVIDMDTVVDEMVNMLPGAVTEEPPVTIDIHEIAENRFLEARQEKEAPLVLDLGINDTEEDIDHE